MPATILNFAGAETGNLIEFTDSEGNVTADSTTKRSGSYSWRFNNGAGEAADAWIHKHSTTGLVGTSVNVDPCYHRFYLYLVTVPSAKQAPANFYIPIYSTISGKCSYQIDSDRKIRLYDNGDSLVATSTTVLSLNTWYLIEIKSSNGASSAYELKINGVSEFSGNCDQGSANTSGARLGITGGHAESLDYYIDDWAIASGDWIGAGACVRIAPTGNGTFTDWTEGTDPKDYTVVDENPYSDTDYVQCGTAGNLVETYTMEDCSTVGISGTINAIKLGARTRENATGKSANKLRIYHGGSSAETAAYNGTTTPATRFLVSTTCPSTSAAWTTTTVDAVEMGVNEESAVKVRCTWLSGFVDFTASTGYSLSCAQGSFSLTGKAAGLNTGRKLAAATGEVALTGQNSSLLRGTKLAAATGSVTLEGKDAALLRALKAVCATGEFALTGQAATLTKTTASTLTANTGSILLFGQDATLSRGLRLAAEASTFTITGLDVSLIVTTVSPEPETPSGGGSGAPGVSRRKRRTIDSPQILVRTPTGDVVIKQASKLSAKQKQRIKQVKRQLSKYAPNLADQVLASRLVLTQPQELEQFLTQTLEYVKLRAEQEQERQKRAAKTAQAINEAIAKQQLTHELIDLERAIQQKLDQLMAEYLRQQEDDEILIAMFMADM